MISEIPILKTTIDPCGSSSIECEMGSLILTESGCKCKCDEGFGGRLCNQLDIASSTSRTNESLKPFKPAKTAESGKRLKMNQSICHLYFFFKLQTNLFTTEYSFRVCGNN